MNATEKHCPTCTCGREAREPTVEALRRWCRERNYLITPFDEIREETAAKILDIDLGRFQNLRYERGDDFIPVHSHGRSKRKYLYIEHLAAYLDRTRDTGNHA